MKYLLLLCVLVQMLSGCSEPPQATVPVYMVKNADFGIQIPGFGELEAASAQSITTPGRTPMAIEWLAEENSFVKKGDVVARFDAEQLSLDSRKEELEMMLLDKDIRKEGAAQYQQLNDLRSEKNFVGKEFEFVDAFAIDDLRLYSKLEIIETLSNRDYLGAKEEFIDWKQGSIGERSQSAIDVLDIRKRGHDAKYNQHQAALALLEVTAPYDGMLVYEQNWRGEKPSVGQTVFPGSIIAKIPNLEKMQAKIYVLDKNAIGLEVGQEVELSLEAHPNFGLRGELLNVSGFSRTIKRGNPTKYFEIDVAIQDTSPLLQPGSKVLANIIASKAKTTVTIPLQAIFNEQGENYVYLKQGTEFVRKTVTTGQKNLYFVEITSGLDAGDEIALSIPEFS